MCSETLALNSETVLSDASDTVVLREKSGATSLIASGMIVQFLHLASFEFPGGKGAKVEVQATHEASAYTPLVGRAPHYYSCHDLN